MDNPLFFVLLLVGLVFILIGLIQFIFPPKKINRIYGYRTSSSMKDKRRWDFAQSYSAKEMMKVGAVFILASLTGLIFNPQGNSAMIIGLTFTVVMVTIFAIRVEKAIKENFRNEVSDKQKAL